MNNKLKKQYIFFAIIALIFTSVLLLNIEYVSTASVTEDLDNHNNGKQQTEKSYKLQQDIEKAKNIKAKNFNSQQSQTPTTTPKSLGTNTPKSTSTKKPVICDHVDVVYTWVNGSDPINFENRNKRSGNKDKTSATTDSQRYRELGSLKYSIRSIKKYAKFIKNIWIVSASQIPTWYDTSYNGNIGFIFHEDLYLNKSDLPTFNSNSIESSLHALPDKVSDCFLYLNDDVFFGNEVSEKDFYDSNKVAIYSEYWTAPSSQNDPWHKSIAYTNRALDRVWKETVRRRYASHGVHSIYKPSIKQGYEDLKVEHANTTSHPFRLPDDLAIPFLSQHYNLRYYDTFQPKKINGYGAFKDNLKEMIVLSEKLLKNRHKTVCINDNLSDKPPIETLDQISKFYESYFPDKGEWEL